MASISSTIDLSLTGESLECLSKLAQAVDKAASILCGVHGPQEIEKDNSSASQDDPDRAVLLLLANAWNAYLKLPARDKIDDWEFMAAIHVAQGIMATRLARRTDESFWRQPIIG